MSLSSTASHSTDTFVRRSSRTFDTLCTVFSFIALQSLVLSVLLGSLSMILLTFVASMFAAALMFVLVAVLNHTQGDQS